MTNTIDNQNLATSQQAHTSVGAANLINRNAVVTNNENSPPKIVDYYIKRPKTCNLLDVSNRTEILEDLLEKSYKNKSHFFVHFIPA